jgi:hypothetical protein
MSLRQDLFETQNLKLSLVQEMAGAFKTVQGPLGTDLTASGHSIMNDSEFFTS